MSRIFLALTLALGLSACAVAPAPVVSAPTVIDQRIAAVSAKLARSCFVLQTAAASAQVFASARYAKAASEAGAVLAAYCAAPPSDVATALTATANALLAFDRARQG